MHMFPLLILEKANTLFFFEIFLKAKKKKAICLFYLFFKIKIKRINSSSKCSSKCSRRQPSGHAIKETAIDGVCNDGSVLTEQISHFATPFESPTR